MIAATKSGSIDGGQVIFITSISSYTASVNRGDYCVSKAGLGMAAKLWAARLAEFGISVFEVQPGIIETDMTGGAKEKYDRLIHTEGLLPIARWGTPADVGMTVAAIAERRLPYSTGAVIPVDGGFHLKTL
jgi:NAD(P)-dependent dehydrogenase (short-subunit alcohol dehydrogenase family)